MNKHLNKLDPQLIEQFDTLGNILGKEHDMQVLINYLQQIPLEPNLQAEREALLNACRKHLARVCK